MPTEIMHAVRMHPIAELHHSPAVPVRLLTKGPGYLRRQMEGAQRATGSAVERLAADKAKYVKSQQQQVGPGNAKQDPPGGSSNNISSSRRRRLGPGGSSASESSSGGSSGSSSYRKSPQAAAAAASPRNSPVSACIVTPVSPSTPASRRGGGGGGGSSKRQLRPDSLVIYRQKSRGDGPMTSAEQARAGLVHRLLHGSLKEKSLLAPPCPPRGAEGEEEEEEEEGSPPGKDPRCRRAGLHRSQSDISSRCSRAVSSAEFDTFFKYCGLEPEVVEELGRESFAPAATIAAEKLDVAGLEQRIRSVSVATSEGGCSRRSGGEGSAGGEGLEEEALSGQLPAGGGGSSNTSVVERNARIIKWLYSCKRAKETRGASPDLP
ncbi:protein FAM110C [Ascaphus truei]|uniref:protein FAM110C n=1 Tax=Ascaphus truei TaxID=8439 RepID=UPI003F5A868F